MFFIRPGNVKFAKFSVRFSHTQNVWNANFKTKQSTIENKILKFIFGFACFTNKSVRWSINNERLGFDQGKERRCEIESKQESGTANNK